MGFSIAAAGKAAEGADLLPIRGFPQLERRNRFTSPRRRVLYASATNNEFFFRWLNQRYARALRGLAVPELMPAGRRVAADLEADGIAFAMFSEFFDPAFFDVIRACFDAYLEEFSRRPRKIKGKAIFIDTVHKSHTFVLDDPVSAYLSEQVFGAIAAQYMGMVPRFVGSSFWRTRVAPDDERKYSQLWHRDYNDRMLTKVFLYATDVGMEEGYFEYVAGSHRRGPLGLGFDRIGEEGFRAYPDPAAVEQVVAGLPCIDLEIVPQAQRSGEAAPWHRAPSVLRCQAPKGTLIFADTFGLHRGGYVQAGHRDMVMTTYSTNFNVHKPDFAVTPAFAESLTPFMRMSFGLQ